MAGMMSDREKPLPPSETEKQTQKAILKCVCSGSARVLAAAECQACSQNVLLLLRAAVLQAACRPCRPHAQVHPGMSGSGSVSASGAGMLPVIRSAASPDLQQAQLALSVWCVLRGLVCRTGAPWRCGAPLPGCSQPWRELCRCAVGQAAG